MHPLENLLRDALSERAARSRVVQGGPVDPDAWEQTVARSRRRRRLGRLPLRAGFVAPLATAAAIVAIIVAVTSIVGSSPGGVPSRTRVGGSPAAAPSPTGRPCTVDRVRALCASAVITVRQGSGDGATVSRYYFGYFISPVTGRPGTSLDFCALVNLQHPAAARSGSVVGGGGCTSASLPVGELVDPGVTQELKVRYGLAARQITSVTALLTDGRRVRGIVVSGRGFPYQVWQLSYPRTDAATLLFYDAAGHQVSTLLLAATDTGFTPPAPGGIALFRASLGTVSAYLVKGLLSFSVANTWVGGYPAAGWPAVTGLISSGVPWWGPEAFGYVHAEVARVVIRLDNGFQAPVSAFVAGWPGSGVRFFATALPASFFPADGQNPDAGPQGTVTAYNSAGRVMAREPLIVTGS